MGRNGGARVDNREEAPARVINGVPDRRAARRVTEPNDELGTRVEAPIIQATDHLHAIQLTAPRLVPEEPRHRRPGREDGIQDVPRLPA
jgi:hypothetical protein